MPRRNALLLAPWAALLLAAASGELGDPTRPALGSAPAASEPIDVELRLESLLLSGERRLAVIGGREVGLGDRVAGGEIVAIELTGVRVRRPEGDVVLTLSGEGIKTPTTARRKGR